MLSIQILVKCSHVVLVITKADCEAAIGVDQCVSSLTSVSQHKKLVEGTLYEEVTSASYSENDISNSLKNGILYLEDPIDHVRVSKCSGVSDSA